MLEQLLTHKSEKVRNLVKYLITSQYQFYNLIQHEFEKVDEVFLRLPNDSDKLIEIRYYPIDFMTISLGSIKKGTTSGPFPFYFDEEWVRPFDDIIASLKDYENRNFINTSANLD